MLKKLHFFARNHLQNLKPPFYWACLCYPQKLWKINIACIACG